jgi:hypothetical protein
LAHGRFILNKKVLVIPITSSKEPSSGGRRVGTRRIWPSADLVLVLLVACFMGLSIFFSKTAPVRKESPSQGEINSLAKQLSSLTQSDLVVFSDGRVWYVRGVQGNNIEIVGWIGDNTKSEEINSFVLADDNFTIVRQNNPKWAEARDRYFKQ